MTTLAILKNRISDDLARADIGAQIADAITDAITHHSGTRFWFNESRTVTFNTVVGQREYDATAHSAIPLIKVDAVYATISGDVRELVQIDPLEMEERNDSNVTNGKPLDWSYYGRALSLYPLPDAVYSMRVLGHLRAPAPVDDMETANVWMTEAFELIRSRAKMLLAMHTLSEPDLATAMQAAEAMARERLMRETAYRMGTGRIVPTTW